MNSKISSEVCFSEKQNVIGSSNKKVDTSISEEEEEEDSILDDYFYSEDDDILLSEGDSISLEEDDSAATKFEQECNTYSIYNPSYPASIVDSDSVKFSIPCSFLPLSQQTVYGLNCHSILLDVVLELSQFDWKLKPRKLQMVHPVKGKNFIGSPLIQNVANSFFSPFYKPKKYYRAQSHLFSFQSVKPDPIMVIQLVYQGFNSEQARKALVFSNNDLDRAIQFLNTGYIYEVKTPITNFVSYHDSPLIYFVLELAEAFLDISRCCCICRKELPTPGVKPSICNSELCKFSLFEIGIGNNICEEIRRDPEAADLVVSLYASSFESNFCKPSYPKDLGEKTIERIQNILQELPAMSELSMCQNDLELSAKIGSEAYELLRWILLSNLSFIISLPESMKMQQFPTTKQFLTLISSPEAERSFDQLRKRYGSVFLWHGSSGNRWHSIVRNGLKVGSGTSLQAHGASYGKGIYFADESSTSWSYVFSSTNCYKNSVLGCDLNAIALCEVAKVPELKDHGFCRTSKREDASIVRYLIIGDKFSANVVNNPPKVPSLREVIESINQKKIN